MTLIPWKERYPDQYKTAVEIADEATRGINALNRPLSADVDYWRQGILEMVIEELQARV